ncbi:glutamate 5-kinase [Suicoccus acidiformans]|uniref:Glutamate 5-kinase n=1 Tax=Suicoccus acidiformans TaxID=2036206 RepID=A0A347WMU1_9LACT|nr:glutamate 5-kinase [Suicoccus acidiformans]AXY26398.1 glutamate 5-kinase [Suicoccus acidiformans]
MKRQAIKEMQRIVIKVGTNTIMKTVSDVDFRKIDRLAFVLSAIRQEGREVILVSSGAVGVGASTLGIDEYPKAIEDQQALAAVGQSVLMGHYGRFFNHYNQQVAQILLTRDVVDFPTSKHNVQRSLESLLARGIIPIINENDVVAVDELNHQTKFGDNDTLSSIVAGLCEADLLVLMSDVEGLYTENPQDNPEAELISEVKAIDESIHEMASGKGSEFSTGGMATKIKAAERMLNNDSAMLITSGDDPTCLFQILEGDQIGTLFMKG